MLKPSKLNKQAKRQAKVEAQLSDCVKRGWLYIDGERDGLPVYKPTKSGLMLAQKKMKGLGLQVPKIGEKA